MVQELLVATILPHTITISITMAIIFAITLYFNIQTKTNKLSLIAILLSLIPLMGYFISIVITRTLTP